jgi:hypothetical protein
MKNKILFKEEQRFRQWWFIILILISVVPAMMFTSYALIQQIRGIQVGETPAPIPVLAILTVFFPVLLWGYFAMKLETWVEQDGFHYRFYPLIWKNKVIAKEEIARFEIRTYNALLDYGGWGIKGSILSRKWKAYNVSGDKGLQLYLKNGKKILFGTQKPQALEYAMNEIMKNQ